MSTQWSGCPCVMHDRGEVLDRARAAAGSRTCRCRSPSRCVGVARADEIAAARAAGGRAVRARSNRARSAPRQPRLHVDSTSGPRNRAPSRRGTYRTSPLVTKRVHVRSAPRRHAAAIACAEQRAHLERGLVGARHQHDVGTHHVADRPGEQRVVRAAEHERVDVGRRAPARAVARRARGPGRSRRRRPRRTRRSPGTPRT